MKDTIIQNKKYLIRFNVRVLSGLGAKVAEFTVEGLTIMDAHKQVRKWIRINCSDKHATYKIF